MPNKKYLKNLRNPTKENPLRVLISACMAGQICGYNEESYTDYKTIKKLLH